MGGYFGTAIWLNISKYINIITWGNQYEKSSRGPDPAALIKFWCVTETVDKIVGSYLYIKIIRVRKQKEDKKIVLSLNL